MTGMDSYEDDGDFLGGQLNSFFEHSEYATGEYTFESEETLDEPPLTEDFPETDESAVIPEPEPEPEASEVPPPTDEEPILEDTAEDGVYGNAYEWHGDWFFQQVDGYCGPTSAAIIVNEYFDAGITDPEYMVNQAYDMGLTNDISQGMYMDDVQKLLEANGVPCENVTSSMDDLANRLENGYGVIAFVDSSEIWEGTGETGEDNTPDYFLVVTEIDTNAGTVTLENPGDPSGNSREIPLEEFENAWADSNYEMISTTATDPDLGGSSNDPQLAIANVTGDVVIQ